MSNRLFNLIMTAFSDLAGALSGYEATAADAQNTGYSGADDQLNSGFLDWGPSDATALHSPMLDSFNHGATSGSFDINPATGLMMVGGIGGFDAAGNTYGTSTMLGAFDPCSIGTGEASGIHDSFGMSDTFSNFDTFGHSDAFSSMTSFDSFGTGSFGDDW